MSALEDNVYLDQSELRNPWFQSAVSLYANNKTNSEVPLKPWCRLTQKLLTQTTVYNVWWRNSNIWDESEIMYLSKA